MTVKYRMARKNIGAHSKIQKGNTANKSA